MSSEFGGGVLSSQQLRDLIVRDDGLITGYGDLESQIQPNGFDMRLAEIGLFAGEGKVTVNNSDRMLPDIEPLAPVDGLFELQAGVYHITYEETVHFPDNLMALGRPRSSLARCGATIHTAVWDAGYSGRSTSMLVVNNPHGVAIEKAARIMQLVFVTLSESTVQRYSGIYQGENTTR